MKKGFSIEDAELLASDFRRQMRLGEDDPVNLRALLADNGIITLFRPMSGVNGMSLMSGGARFMLINSNTTVGRQNFSIAHELYHLYYDENPEPHFNLSDEDSGEEKKANLFASALLLPRMSVYRIFKDVAYSTKIDYLEQVIKAEQIFSVSHSCLVKRLYDLRMINVSQRESLYRTPIRDISQNLAMDVSIYNPGNENLFIGDYGIKAKKLFDAEKISEGHYNELLSLVNYGN